MRVVSHTCSNTEIVCALGCADQLVAVDSDSDYPPEVVRNLVQLGRDLDLDTRQVPGLQPDLVLTSLTVPGHERIVAEFQAQGLPCLVMDPRSLADVYGDIRRIAAALGVVARGEQLVAEMEAAMPPQPLAAEAPRILVEWWPKPVIGAAAGSWVDDLIRRAGGRNALDGHASPTATPTGAPEAEAIVMSWCGVKLENYRAEVVLRREGWQDVTAIRRRHVVPITEAWLGRPGPRLVEGYRALRAVVARCQAERGPA
ncbi:MAG TPA: ABC transporter substrate-binding protein [Solimonas sp.]|nr:ABC transporter substrate-binding protein [Solimonas sp.]